MNYTVIKRNGQVEKFNFDKIYKHIVRACEGLNVDPNKLVENFRIRLKNEMQSSEIQESLYITAASLGTIDEPDWSYVGARLLLEDTYKRIYGSHKPRFDFKELKKRIELGYYDPEILEHFTEEEFNELAKIIKWENDYKFTYLGLKQMLTKYSIRRKGLSVETPQEIYFLISMYIFARNKNKEKRASKIKKMYKKLSNFDIFLSTPPMVGIRSKKRGFTSCAGINYGDSIESLANATKTMMKLITKLNAGIGGDARFIRGLGADINNGQEVHTGITPYLKVYESVSKSSMQPNSGRSGAVTNYYPFFHWEIEDILTLKNNKGSDENSVRHSDHAIIFNALFYERLLNGGNITLFHINKTGELSDLMGYPEKFKELYEKLEKDPRIEKKVISAKYLYDRYKNERYITSRVYKTNGDEMQKHSAFNLPTVTSNLCLAGDTKVKIKRDDKEKEVDLKDVRVGDFVLSKNLKTGEIEYKLVKRSFQTSPKAKVMEIADENGNSIICTPDHKVYTKNRGYVEAKDLKETDVLDLVSDSANITKNKETKIITINDEIPVYDIEVEDNHNFYANGILVHNCTEINLPSFPDEDYSFLVKNKKEFYDWFDKLYEDGKWYQLYRFIQYNVMDKENQEIVSQFNGYLDENGKPVTINFGEVFSCILGGVNWGNLSLNDEKRRKQIKDAMHIMVNFLDEMIDYQDYAGIKPFEKFTKNRRALGISPGNLFYLLARAGADYNSEEARALVHKVIEEMLYFGIQASVELAKEKGACKYFADTKYSKGILPIDTYNKNVDTLLENNTLKLDWESLRKDILEFGMRNSTLLTAVPSSNSSRPANMISGINPPQSIEYNIEDQKMKVTGFLPDVKKYKKFYEKHIAWDLEIIEYWKLVAILQKFIDQAISINEYVDFTKYPNKQLPEKEFMRRDLFTIKYGLKTIYYAKTKTNEDEKELEYESEGCSGGGCTL
jgi:ribonucleotide reductase alpha subunit